MRTFLIIIAVIICLLVLRYLFFSIIGRRNITQCNDVLSLINPNHDGWAGIRLGDSYKYVLSRLQHLGFMDKEGVENQLSYYEMVGASAGISFPATQFSGIMDGNFRFASDEKLKSISFFFQKEYSTKDNYSNYKSRMVQRFGSPIYDSGDKGDTCTVQWRNLTLTLLKDDPQKPEMLILISPR